LLLILSSLFSLNKIELPLKVVSPNGKVEILFQLDLLKRPVYSVRYRNSIILKESSLGIEFKQNGLLSKGLKVTGTNRNSYDMTYKLVVGKSKFARDHHNELIVSLMEEKAPYRKIKLAFRVFNDGAAFRYIFPEQKAFKTFEILAENSEFRFPQNHTCWPSQFGKFKNSNESQFIQMTLNDINIDTLIACPLTIQRKDGITLALTEANLTNYSGMYLQKKPDENYVLYSRLSPSVSEKGNDVCAEATPPFVSPWRVLMIGDKPGDLIESNIILNLNEPCAIKDVSWIKPGKVIFPWWWWPDFTNNVDTLNGEYTFAHQKLNIDFAAANNIEYLELEPPWYGPEEESIKYPERFDITKPLPEIHLPELLRYAHQRNVGMLLWVHWKSLDIQMDEAFSLYQKWDAKGVKIDFMDRNDQDIVNFYHRVLKKAADHKLMVWFHGAYKPTGIRRTWPNLLTREGILGNEYSKWSRTVTPEHNVIIPFTRMLAGPMDFTPGGFTNVTKEGFKPKYDYPMVMGTRCHQLAMFVVYESQLQMICDQPNVYKNDASFEFIRKVPTNWDDTRVLCGEIGDYIAIARKKGNTWFIGAMTDWTPRQLNLPLTFLESGKYDAKIFADGSEAEKKPEQFSISKKILTASDSLQIELASGGGYAVCLKPQNLGK
jgi:alpha-glucosidase